MSSGMTKATDTPYRALVVDDDIAVRKATIRALDQNGSPATRLQMDSKPSKWLHPTATMWW